MRHMHIVRCPCDVTNVMCLCMIHQKEPSSGEANVDEESTTRSNGTKRGWRLGTRPNRGAREPSDGRAQSPVAGHARVAPPPNADDDARGLPLAPSSRSISLFSPRE